jgi:hypothetical protein
MPLPRSWCLIFVSFLLTPPATQAWAQDRVEVIFDEESDAAATFRDASWGFAAGNAFLRRGGPGNDKLPVSAGGAYSGNHSGVIEWRTAPIGDWELFIAGDGWRSIDLTDLDTLAFQLRAPAPIPAEALPRIGLEDMSNRKTALLPLADYFQADGQDRWIRVAIPIDAFDTSGGFDATRFKAVRFAQGGVSAEVYLLGIDFVRAFTADPNASPPAPPRMPTHRTGERSVILRWEPAHDEEPFGYRVYRALEGQSLEPIGPALLQRPLYVDLDLDHTTVTYAVAAMDAMGRASPLSESVTVTSGTLTDEAFVDLIQRTAFDYFWYEANPENGLVRDRSTAGSPSSVAAVGFGLSAMCIGAERGWITREQAVDRVLTTLRTFHEMPQGTATQGTIGHRGFFYHFLGMETATRSPGSELSSIDTALLLAGVLHARHYFDRGGHEETIRALADSLYEGADWQWMTNNDISLTHGWFPESGFISHRWIGYDEGMILYLLAMGSPTSPLPSSSWREWTRGYNWATHYGLSFVTFPPLFGHQYSHAWIDFRGVADEYMRGRGTDYFENSRRATLASRAYAIDNPGGFTGYGENIWGITASDGPSGYLARGAPPAMNDNGTIAPTAAGGSIAFTPAESIAALRTMYDLYRTRLWGEYGFRDAFNIEQDWFASDVLGIDQGIILLMAENHRSGHVWEHVMRDERLQHGLHKAGFEVVVGTGDEHAFPVFSLDPVYPNPVAERADVAFSLERPGHMRIVLYDVLGREVAVVMDGFHPAGPGRVAIDVRGHAAGLYHLVLRADSRMRSHALIVVR